MDAYGDTITDRLSGDMPTAKGGGDVRQMAMFALAALGILVLLRAFVGKVLTA